MVQVLDHRESYEWFGNFWFPENADIIFAGKINYSADSGIKITLFIEKSIFELCREIDKSNKDLKVGNEESTFIYKSDTRIKKNIMHANVTGDKENCQITLCDITLFMQKTFNFSLSTYNCHCAYLIKGYHFRDLQFDKVCVVYDKCFEKLFFSSNYREQALKKMQGSNIKIGDYKIKTDFQYSYGIFSNSEKIADKLIGSEETIAKIKTLLLNSNVTLPDKIDFVIELNKRNTQLSDFINFIHEEWNLVWQILLDDMLLCQNLWVYENNNSTASRCYVLLNQKYKKTLKSIDYNYLTIYSFAEEVENFSNIEPVIQNWVMMVKDVQYEYSIILETIRRIIIDRQKIDRAKFLMLYATITAFIGLDNVKARKEIKTLIEKYAFKEWGDSLTKTLNLPNDNKDTFDESISKIRGCIVHPKNNSKKEKIYVSIIQDDIQLNNIYAHLCGLFIKAVLAKIGIKDSVALEKYTMQLISRRVFFQF